MDYRIVKELPKIELHCHLDGSVSVELLQELAQKDGVAGFDPKSVQTSHDCTSLKEYLSCFEHILPFLQSAENLTLATLDVIRQAALENVAYLEIRVAPLLHQQAGLSITEVIDAVVLGVEQGRTQYLTKTNLLIIGMRHHTHQEHEALLADVLASTKESIVGFDFAGDEAAHDTLSIAPSISVVHQSGLNLTLHAGECGCYQNVIEAVKLGAKRIGHGIAIKDSEEAIALCAKEKVLLEMCPTSNLQSKAIQSLDEFPLRTFFAKQVPFMISTDNRTVSNTTLTDEYMLLATHFGLTYREMMEINQCAMTYSFADSLTKATVLAKISQSYQDYLD